MGRCVLPNLSAKTHIAALPGRGRAYWRGPGPTSGASGVRRGGAQSRALMRRRPAPSRCTRRKIAGVLRRGRRRVACGIWAGAALFYRVVDPELAKEVVKNHPIRIEGGARVHAPRLPPCEELLDVLRRDKPGVGPRGHVLGKEFEDVFVFSVRHQFAERADILKKRVDRRGERQGIRFGFFFGVVD